MKESRYNIWLEHAGARYVFNGVSGALLRLSETEYTGFRQYMAGETSVFCSFELLEEMAKSRIFIPDDADEITFLQSRYRTSRGDTSHFALTIVTSLGCNFDCPYCFETKQPSVLNAEVEQYILEVLDHQVPRIKTFGVTWFGGEPLVGKKPLMSLSDAFIERCDSHGVQYSASIITNGYLLDEKMCLELRRRRVSSAQIGLDGPAAIHDKMRPLAGGNGSFSKIVENLHHAVKHLRVAVRVNLDKENASEVGELLRLLEAEGLAGKLVLYPGQLTKSGSAVSAFSLYSGTCFSNPEFAAAEYNFELLAQRYGFDTASLPAPTCAPCTAVRKNELVIGSEGELYKCWNTVGNAAECIGNIRDAENTNGRQGRWLKYDPFSNAECRDCIALPVCMGGCALHAMSPDQYENRCGTFRHNYSAKIRNLIESRKEPLVTILIPAQGTTRGVETR